MRNSLFLSVYSRYLRKFFPCALSLWLLYLLLLLLLPSLRRVNGNSNSSTKEATKSSSFFYFIPLNKRGIRSSMLLHRQLLAASLFFFSFFLYFIRFVFIVQAFPVNFLMISLNVNIHKSVKIPAPLPIHPLAYPPCSGISLYIGFMRHFLLLNLCSGPLFLHPCVCVRFSIKWNSFVSTSENKIHTVPNVPQRKRGE